MTNLRVWIHSGRLRRLGYAQAISEMAAIKIYTFPVEKDDLCYELVPVSREVLEREAAEGIKALDEEGEK